MHYFAPPVQAAVSLLKKRGIRGKFEALRLAKEIFPDGDVIDMILDTVAHHYEIPQYYQESTLAEIERKLESYLRNVYGAMADHVTLIEVDVADTAEDLKAKIARMSVNPAEVFYEGTKFCRFMKGRLLFYGTSIPWFDAVRLIRHEIGRIVPNFYEKPLVTFGFFRFQKELSPHEVLDRLRGNLLSPEICDGVVNFIREAKAPIPDGKERERARAVADVFEPVQQMVEILSGDMR